MNNKKRMKLCAHCEGDVDLEVIICPYCGKDVSEQKMTSHMQTPFSSRNSLVRSLSPDETLNSLYPPPYRPKVYDQQTTNIPTDIEDIVDEEEENQELVADQELSEEKKVALIPVILFSLGINLCLFGLFLFFFSSKGEIWLHWKSTMSIVYIILSLPFLYFGYKKIV